MSKCLRCGRCCKYIYTNWNLSSLSKNTQEREFLMGNFYPKSVLKGMIENPWLILVTILWWLAGKKYKKMYRYECLKLKGHLCSINGDKPKICQGFPVYNENGNQWKRYLPWNGCGYRKL